MIKPNLYFSCEAVGADGTITTTLAAVAPKHYVIAGWTGRDAAAIEHHIHELQKIDSKELDKLAILRVIEVTNGCTQWGFRRKDEQCLSV